MPTFVIYWRDCAEQLEADSLRTEGIHQVLRGVRLVIGRPREVVLRRVPREVLVEQVRP